MSKKENGYEKGNRQVYFQDLRGRQAGARQVLSRRKQADKDYGSAHGLRKKDHSDLAEGMDAAKALLGRLQDLSLPKYRERRKFYVRNK